MAPRPPIIVNWTFRRAASTAFYTFIGVLIGISMTPMLAALVGLPLMVLIAPVGKVEELFCAVATALALPWPAWWLASRGAQGTCAKSPAAPTGIAIGLGIGSLAACALLARTNLGIYVLLLLPTALVQARAGFVGGW